MRLDRSRLPIKVSARCARLNPEIHSKGDYSFRLRLGEFHCRLGRRHWTPTSTSYGLSNNLSVAFRREADISPNLPP